MWTRTPREWQPKAYAAAMSCNEPCVIHAVTGAGKSDVISALAETWDGPVLITTPSIALVEQLARPGYGRLYTRGKVEERITVACNDSILLYTARPGLLVIIDEAHKSESEGFLAAIKRLGAKKLVGFTATPFRSSKKEDLSLFSRVAYSYDAAAAFRDGVCIAPRVVQWTHGEANVDDAIRKMLEGAEKPAIVTAANMADADAYAATLPRALPIHSGYHDRAERIEALRTGQVDCLVHVDLLTAGVDLPWLRTLALRVPISSPVRFCQQVGRVMRSCEGKTSCTILDPHDLFGVHELSPEAALNGAREDDDQPPVLLGVVQGDGQTVLIDQDPMLCGIWHGTRVMVAPREYPGHGYEMFVETASRERLWFEGTTKPGEVTIRPRAWSSVRARRRKAGMAESMTEVQAWLRSELLTLSFSGKKLEVKSRKWRKLSATPAQRDLAERLFKRASDRADSLPGDLRLALRAAAKMRKSMDRGTLSDAITLLISEPISYLISLAK